MPETEDQPEEDAWLGDTDCAQEELGKNNIQGPSQAIEALRGEFQQSFSGQAPRPDRIEVPEELEEQLSELAQQYEADPNIGLLTDARHVVLPDGFFPDDPWGRITQPELMKELRQYSGSRQPGLTPVEGSEIYYLLSTQYFEKAGTFFIPGSRLSLETLFAVLIFEELGPEAVA